MKTGSFLPFYCLVLALTVFSGAVSPVHAETTPGALVLETVEKVRKTVTESRADMTAEEVDQKLRDIIAPVFDFEEMSRRSLGANWRKGTPDQRKEFVSLFSDLLATNYLKRIRDNAATSEVSVVNQRTRERQALVQTVVAYDGDQARIDYRMSRRGEDWRVYDVVIENIGLVSNYRNEFAGILSRGDFESLLKLLREKSKGEH